MNPSGEKMLDKPFQDLKFQFELDIPGLTYRNSDNEFLMPSGSSRVVIGTVDEVNSEGAQEVHGFVATRYELLELTRHWQRKVLDLEFFEFFNGQYGSSTMRIVNFGKRRISRIAEL